MITAYFVAFWALWIGVAVAAGALRLNGSGSKLDPRALNQVNSFNYWDGKIQLVVSHHIENMDALSWIKQYPHLVYDRAARSIAAFNSTWQENVGREGYVYLKHIIDYYHELADLTIFLQADASNNPWQVHSPTFESNVHGLANGSTILTELSDGFAFLGAEGNCMGKISPFSTNLPRGYEGEFRKQLNFVVPNPRFVPQGLFAVTKEAIRRNPVAYYAALLRKLGKHPNAAYELFLEHAWPEVFHSNCGAHPRDFFCFPGPPQYC